MKNQQKPWGDIGSAFTQATLFPITEVEQAMNAPTAPPRKKKPLLPVKSVVRRQAIEVIVRNLIRDRTPELFTPKYVLGVFHRAGYAACYGTALRYAHCVSVRDKGRWLIKEQRRLPLLRVPRGNQGSFVCLAEYSAGGNRTRTQWLSRENAEFMARSILSGSDGIEFLCAERNRRKQ